MVTRQNTKGFIDVCSQKDREESVFYLTGHKLSFMNLWRVYFCLG